MCRLHWSHCPTTPWCHRSTALLQSDPATPVCSSSGVDSKIPPLPASTFASCPSHGPWLSGLPWTCTRRQPCWRRRKATNGTGRSRPNWRLSMRDRWHQRLFLRQRYWMTAGHCWQVRLGNQIFRTQSGAGIRRLPCFRTGAVDEKWYTLKRQRGRSENNISFSSGMLKINLFVKYSLDIWACVVKAESPISTKSSFFLVQEMRQLHR